MAFAKDEFLERVADGKVFKVVDVVDPGTGGHLYDLAARDGETVSVSDSEVSDSGSFKFVPGHDSRCW